jgi:hypothetical protein
MYECDDCKFSTNNITNYTVHLNTKKHKNKDNNLFCK